MNTYLIEHKISTLAELCDPFEYKGFTFKHWDFNFAQAWIGKAWTAKKIVSAEDVTRAIGKFRNELFPIIDRISFISQCYVTAEGESFLIFKNNNNNNRCFFMRYSKEVDGVPLSFRHEEIESLLRTEALENDGKAHIFRYFREANNAVSSYTYLAMLVAALEGIAGETTPNVTNKDFICNEILKDKELYDKIFAYGEGIRNQILHGKPIDIKHDETDYGSVIYAKTVEYFNRDVGTSIASVVRPHRKPTGNYKMLQTFLEPTNKEREPVLKEVSEIFDNRSYENDFKGLFTMVDMPAEY